ncbi:hypothetical protein Fmac_026458 [Flemingia macrophylla]|uniref:Uncharacterized protein n=1 Tax=Flemingia macrophylla TaxID=520843 RepID=A0ABD1LEY7_9FABA
MWRVSTPPPSFHLPILHAVADFTLDSVHHLDNDAAATSPLAEQLTPDLGPDEAIGADPHNGPNNERSHLGAREVVGLREPARVEWALVGEFLRLEKGVKSLFHHSSLNFTFFEALGAYIWRGKVLASRIKGHEMVKFAYLINIRRLVQPPLPAGATIASPFIAIRKLLQIPWSVVTLEHTFREANSCVD